MEIRDAAPGDEVAAVEVLRRSIIELCHADHWGNAEILANWLRNKTAETVATWIVRTDAAMLLAVDEKAVVGVGMVTKAGDITLNYVSPDARFQGISKAILHALETRALQDGVTNISLTSTLTARRFYIDAGYLNAGFVERENAWVVYSMVKHLLSTPETASTT